MAVVHLTFIDVTGLIYVAIIALWAAVLIPMWLRRHDDDQARRVERHRVAMGTLARIARDPEEVQSVAARRRRVIVAATATIGALGSAAWVAGLVPGLVAGLAWLPLVVFLPAAILSERRAARVTAERALEERRERRVARAHRGTNDLADHSTDNRELSDAREVVAPSRPRVHDVPWDEVFDQTA